jgi:hypothetical protein
MEEALRYFRTYEVWVYLGLSLIGLYYVRKFILYWQELRGATFGLERESAQARVNTAASVLLLVFTMVLAEFVLTSFVAPVIPKAIPLLTPTLDLLATPTITLQANLEGTQATEVTQVVTRTIEIPANGATGCVPGQVSIDLPKDGTEVSNIVEIQGTANSTSFGFYKLEMKRPDEQKWLTILAGNETRQNAVLGAWNTSLLAPGEYQLALVVVDNQGQSLPPCVIQIRIASSAGTPTP